jgi:hypothetical protein
LSSTQRNGWRDGSGRERKGWRVGKVNAVVVEMMEREREREREEGNEVKSVN